MPRMLALFAMLALLLAPFGRVAAADAAPASHGGAAMAGAGHCEDMGTAGEDRASPQAIDCMIACAMVAAATAPQGWPTLFPSVLPRPAPALGIAGLAPEAEPPPPRFA